MIKILFAAFILLTGCASTPAYVPPPMTNKQISEVNDAALCSLSSTQADPRIITEIKSRRLDCDHASLVCGAKGIKKGTRQFSQCKSNQYAQHELNERKQSNPALGYCIDSGFKTGTAAMATCMAAYNQEQHNQFMFERQQESQREEMSERAAQERSRRWSETIKENNDRMIKTMEMNRQNNAVPAPNISSPVTTNCEPNGFGGVRCTTY